MRCIDPEGEQLGVIDTFDAIRKAEEFGLDLVEVQPNVDPPVCKILDYGKFKYAAQKRANEARKELKILEKDCLEEFFIYEIENSLIL